VVQFVLNCRPFYIAGFNAQDLVPKVLLHPKVHKTIGNQGPNPIARFHHENSRQLVTVFRVSSYSICMAAVREHKEGGLGFRVLGFGFMV
jgi:hypothetical protein